MGPTSQPQDTHLSRVFLFVTLSLILFDYTSFFPISILNKSISILAVMNDITTNATLSQNLEVIKEMLKREMLQKLEDYDWKERMRLKCQSYIKQNGTKTTTVEEIMDNIFYEAMKTFPANIQAEIEEKWVEYGRQMVQSMIETPSQRSYNESESDN